MTVRVKLFAAAREIAATDEVIVDIVDGATIGEVRRALVAASPSLERIVAHALFAVDGEYASDSTGLQDGSEIALIPPVSGG